MRLHILAVGFGRGTLEGPLGEDFINRARQLGKRMGFPAIVCEEIPVSKDRDVRKRLTDEAERLAKRVPQGAHIVLLDATGKGMTSEDFAEMLGALRDAGTRDL